MKKLIVPLVLLSFAAAAQHGTVAEAKAMLAKAVAHYKTVGRKQALAGFSAGKPPFRDRDLYVVCIGTNGFITANGGFPEYVGASPDVWKDAKGRKLSKAFLESVTPRGDVTLHYNMVNPVTGKIEPKTLYGQKLGEDVCGVGVYGE